MINRAEAANSGSGRTSTTAGAATIDTGNSNSVNAAINVILVLGQ